MRPLVTVLTPVYRPGLAHLEQCLDSVRAPGVEHILIIDGRENVEKLSVIERLAVKRGAKVVVCETHGGISAATNAGAEAARGEFIVLVDQDDFLEPNWFDYFQLACPEADMLYSDMYTADQHGQKVREYRKPDWSPIRLAFNMYACHFLALRRELFLELGGMRSAFDGAQDHDIALRFARQGARVHHIPVPLYSWRQIPTSTALDPDSKPYASEAGRKASQEHLDKIGVPGQIVKGELAGGYIANFPQRNQPVSVVIPTAFGRDDAKHSHTEDAIKSLYMHLGSVSGDELILVSGGEDDLGLLAGLSASAPFSITHVIDRGKFNFSRRSNIGFESARNELVLLMNDDVVLDTEPCLNQMVGLLAFENVGIVGSQLVFPGMLIQHGGHIYIGRPGHAYYRFGQSNAPLFDLMVDREVSGVTAALTLQKKSTWRAVGGFCEALPLNYNDVDYCLKVAALGLSSVLANSSKAVHHESITRNPKLLQREIDILMSRWRDSIQVEKYTRDEEASFPRHPEWEAKPKSKAADELLALIGMLSQPE
jgi:GT2 family glycosyltransferase